MEFIGIMCTCWHILILINKNTKYLIIMLFIWIKVGCQMKMRRSFNLLIKTY